MAGKRLIDAAAIFSASRATVRKHVALRTHQLEAYNKTSTFGKAIKSQTDRVTLTVQAALALARRFNDASPSYSNQAQQGRPVSTNERPSGKGSGKAAKEGIHQDHFYEKSQANSAAGQAPEGELGVKQQRANRSPLPDGSIPPTSPEIGTSVKGTDQTPHESTTEPVKKAVAEDKTEKGDDSKLSSFDGASIKAPKWHASALPPEKARILQREAEMQIPSQAADEAASDGSDPAALKLEQGRNSDVFYTRSSQSSPILSSLPTKKVPQQVEDTQGSNRHLEDGQINSDVFYSSQGSQQNEAVPRTEAVPEKEQVQEEVNTDIFNSPRIAKLLSGKDKAGSQGLEMKGAGRVPMEKTRLAQDRDQDTFNVRSSTQNAPESGSSRQAPSNDVVQFSSEDRDADMQSLAADTVDFVNSAPSQASHISTPVEPQPTKEPYRMQESQVPSSRFGRLWQYGGLATGMAMGAVSESLRRVAGGSEGQGGSLMLSAGNMERLVSKLSKMRGAALKLGQMMSFQDSKMLPAPIQEVLQRVQDNADYMPAFQRNRVLAANLGSDWRHLFSSFDEMPLAAASIGQVHGAILKSTGQRVAVKVQYPGVADSIDSDLSNLAILLTASRLLPKGLYLDKTIANARTELAWECDYIREAECGKKFGHLLRDEEDVFTVPDIIDEASGKAVLTMERMEGIGITKVQTFNQEQKDWIGTQILRLCLREITEFKFMQTDPNWTNFLYNDKTNKLELLDFGASRAYPSKFIDPYIQLLLAASRNDRDACRTLSIQLGYLTGHEPQTMLNAHITSILTLAEPFRDSSPEVYDFRDQSITERVKKLIPVMIRERLVPPPEETYSLHRKLSGAFLLCARLGSRIRCREMFANAMGRSGLNTESLG